MSARPHIRVLHVLGGMSRGGIETWLMHVLRHSDRARLQMDFLVHTAQPCPYDDEVRALGGAIIPCPYAARPPQYAAAFLRLLRRYGPYDVVHSHVHHYSGFVLALAQRAGVPVRVAHSHNDTSPIQATASVSRRAYYAVMERGIARYATRGLAASRAAAVNLFGAAWEQDRRWRVLHYGIDLAPFTAPSDAATARRALGLPPEALVLGHVGRFYEQKNHAFLVDIATALCAAEPGAHLLLVGDGALRPEIERKVRAVGLLDRVVFAGGRSDVPQLMRAAIDVFVLPSLYEGLPLVTIEAQAAGLPCVLSDHLTMEIDRVPGLVRRVPLTAPAAVWAQAILAAQAAPRPTPAEALAALCGSSFDINTSRRLLEDAYHDDLGAQLATGIGYTQHKG